MALLTLFIASLLGSPHCAAMCGGFALFCVGQETRKLNSSIAYNLGRLLTYTTLGAALGALGAGFDKGLEQLGIANGIAFLVGGLLIFWGTAQLFGFAKIKTQAQQGFFAKLYQRALTPVLKFPPVPRALIIGILSTLLPCGWLYAFLAQASASGSAFSGALTMTVFWSGTLPIMLALGQFSRVVLKRWGAQVPALTAGLLIASGIFSILSHLGVLAGGHLHGGSCHMSSE